MAEWFEDAFTGTEEARPQFMRMVEAMLSNGIKVVVVESLDRLARDVVVQSLLLSKLAASGLALYAANTGENVTEALQSDPTRKAMIQIQSVFAELEKSLLVAKLRKARAAKKAATGRCEGRKRFGEMPGEAETLKRMKQLYRKPRGQPRKGFTCIARKLNAEGLPTRMGGPWRADTVRQILERR